MKFRLSSTVVFSSVIGYLLGTDYFSFADMSYLIIGGILVTGSANAFNQILEKNGRIPNFMNSMLTLMATQ